MTAEDQEQTRAAWDDIAPGYDRFVTPTHLSLAERALEQAGLAEGMRFLDVACGTGALAIPAARLGAEVTAADIAPAMVDLVTARAREEGLANLEGIVTDGHALDLDDDSFDVAGSQFGVMLFPDLPRGLREMVRVTRPGGRVVVVAFGPPAEVEFIGFMMTAIKTVVPDFEGLPSDPPPLPFQVADRDLLHSRLSDAGLRDIDTEPVTEELEMPSGQALWDWLMNSNPIPGRLVADLTDPQKAEVRQALDRLVRERAGSNGAATLTHPINIAVGTK